VQQQHRRPVTRLGQLKLSPLARSVRSTTKDMASTSFGSGD